MLVKNNKETIMKFKSVAAALLAAVTCVSMAACGSGGDTNADGKVEITMGSARVFAHFGLRPSPWR